MTDRLDPVTWYYILRNGQYDTVRIIDQYDASDVYESSYKWEERSKWDAAAAMQRACYIADSCVVAFEDVDHNTLFWLQVILDEGYPRISDMSNHGHANRLIHQAQAVTDRVSTGHLSLHTVMSGGVDLNAKENNNG